MTKPAPRYGRLVTPLYGQKTKRMLDSDKVRIYSNLKIRCILVAIVIPAVLAAQEGRLVENIVHSMALEDNLLNDSPDRNVLIYLPPSYNLGDDRYPVLYLLHGNSIHNTIWTQGFFQGMNIKASMDSLIFAELIREMILVMPDVHNRYRGSHYVNSSTTGNWADFITRDLVQYIDTTYRTIPNSNSRGLSGHSMGGRGTFYLAMSYPGIYGAIYGLSSGQMDFGESLQVPDNPEWWSKLLTLQDISQADRKMVKMIGCAAAFTPNPNRPPFYVDFQYKLTEGKVLPIDTVWRKWLAYDPVALVSSRETNLPQLHGIRFDCGQSDHLVSDNRAFARELTEAGISHEFEEYEGNHINRIRERIETRLLPYFSNILEFSPSK
jgi:enterochelin esterase-like enzyme